MAPTAPALARADVRAPDPSPPSFRLPGDVVPVRYRLDQTIVPTADKASGILHIDAQVVRPTRAVWLNATDIAVGHAELAGKPARVIPGGEDFVGLVADADLPTGPLAIDVEGRRDRRDLRVHVLRTDRRAARLPLLRRARLQGPLDARVPRQAGSRRARERARRQGDRRAQRHEARRVRRVKAPAELPGRVRRRAVRARRRRRRRPDRDADPLHHPEGPRGRARLRQGGHAEGRRRARDLLRHGLPVRQARRRGRAPVLGDDGAPRHRRDGPAAHVDPSGRGVAIAEGALREHPRARAVALLVQRSGHDEVVG